MIATRLSSRWRAITPSHAPRSRGTVAGRGSAHTSSTGSSASTGSASRLPVAAIHHPLLGRVGAPDLGRDAALVQDEDPVGHREDLGEVARDEDDRQARTRPARR